MPSILTESHVEDATLEWLSELGYTVLHGPDIAPGELLAERETYAQVVLAARLRRKLSDLNPHIPAEVLDEAARKVTRLASPSLINNNRLFHRMLVDGVEVEYKRADDSIAGDSARLIDFDEPDNNEWLAINQFTVIEGQYNRRPDIVLFVNGLPLTVIELKNVADEKADIWTAFKQLQTYKLQITPLFISNETLIISDSLDARLGTISSDRERFMPWRTIEGEELAPASMLQLEVLLRGAFEKQRFLDLIRYFTVFEDDGSQVIKKIAGYHQFHAVNLAVAATVAASGPGGDKRGGVVWHTQGSGKSLTMAFYAGRLVLHPRMENPTLVVITDRNDLDDQLFGTFSRCHELLRQKPVQAESRAHLRELLQVASGGVVFTTIQKFLPEEKGDRHPQLSDRRNVVVIADEAHRTQYGFEAKVNQKSGQISYGLAQYVRDALPNASFIGFTGTPIELEDRNTRAVFGEYISVYDIERALLDGATVPIYYESRLAKLALDESERPHVDEKFEDVTEGEEIERKEKLKTKWAALEALVGSEKRVRLIAEDIVRHFGNRLTALPGKAMIVGMSRRICVDLYKAIVELRPEWHNEDDTQGTIKVVMTGNASDNTDWQPHIRNKPRREALAKRFKDERDELKLVIVRDMWLTGFDAPMLHTMYVDKPMRGHNLMQAIARVNRVYKDKPGGLIVDYLGLAEFLRDALSNYTASGGRGKTSVDIEEAVAVMQEKYEICCALFYGFDWSVWRNGAPMERLRLIPVAQEHILKQAQGKTRLLQAVAELSKAFALASSHDDALSIRVDVAFFQTIRAALVKTTTTTQKGTDELDHAIRQIVSQAVATDEVIDIFSAAGLKKPDVSILSEEFLAEVRAMPQKNLAVELLRKLLNDEIKTRSRRNLVQSRSFADMLERTIRAYQNRAIETAQVIEELIRLGEEMREAHRRGEDLNLTDDEIAFYDALEVNDSAVKVLGDETLKAIARELVETVRRNVTIDWSVKESVRAKLRTLVKRILRKHGYPPDKQEQATDTVIKQAEHLCLDWAA
jgi:type I restriction enzyme R subunit